MAYLEEAAALLRKAARDVDAVQGSEKDYDSTYASRRAEIADGFARLALVERGISPFAPPDAEE